MSRPTPRTIPPPRTSPQTLAHTRIRPAAQARAISPRRGPRPRNVEPGTRNLEPGTSNQEPGSRDRILNAALAEFADRGFAGARVDRIASAAGLNKAMLYYHFGSKARLYRTTIQSMLDRLATHLERVASSDLPPTARLDAYIETFITLGLAEPRIAPIMLREVAEGAAHLDQDTVRVMVRLVTTMATIVDEGRKTGDFREINPLLAYLTTVWPIMIYLASGPIRETIQRHSGVDMQSIKPDLFLRHMQDISRRALAPGTPALSGPETSTSNSATRLP